MKVFIYLPPLPQLVVDPINHVTVDHGTTNVHSRSIPCPLGCGTVLHPRYCDKTLPQWELDVHTYGDACKERLLQIEAARAECAAYLQQKAQEEAVVVNAEEMSAWGE